MNRIAFAVAAVLLASACQSGLEVGSNNSMSYEEFVETFVYQEPMTGMYIVNGDETIRTEEELREFYYLFAHDTSLIVHQAGGVDAKWSDSQKLDLTYCVSTGFGSRYNQMVDAMAAATGDWEGAANVNFIHNGSNDSSCDNRTSDVFNVSPVNSGCRYLAAAFFPNYSRRDRQLVVDPCSFSYDDSGQISLEGILRHELGHALGFRHEHTRPEAGACFEDTNWRELTPYDSSSVMHYPQCNGTNTWELRLTNLDRQGAASLYGSAGGGGGGGDGDGDGDGDECLPVGDFCSSNADCCSNKCKGKPGAKTCK
jgi:hypothetical protein